MTKQGIEDYLVERYISRVKLWQDKTTNAVLHTKDLEKMLSLEDILRDCFGYNIKNGCHDTELFKGKKLIFKYNY